MKVLSIETYTTSVFYIKHSGEEYVATHRDDADGFLTVEWEIKNQDDDEVYDKELRSKLLKFAKKQLKAK